MARTKGMLNLSGNLEVNAGAPLDARSVVPTLADLTVASNFPYKYVGMPVVVQATGEMYILMDMDVTDIANWKLTGSGGGGSFYTAGDGIDITNDEISVKVGSNLSFDSSGNLNATDTTYTAGDGIVIEDDEISTDNMPAADMAEIVTPLPSVMSRLHKYSSSPQKIGIWTNDKTIYEIVGTLPTGATELYSFSMGGSTVRWYTTD